MLPSFLRPTNVLALLLSGVLLLSLVLNGVLLAARPETWPVDDDAGDELAATTADLHLTQRLLAQCQQQRQDSLLATRQRPAGGAAILVGR